MLNIFEILIFWQQKSCRSGCRTKDLLLSGSQKWQWYWSFFQWWAMTYLLIIDLVQTAVVGRSGRANGVAPVSPPTPPDVRFSASGG
jgi:hypothetical protein